MLNTLGSLKILNFLKLGATADLSSSVLPVTNSALADKPPVAPFFRLATMTRPTRRWPRSPS